MFWRELEFLEGEGVFDVEEEEEEEGGELKELERKEALAAFLAAFAAAAGFIVSCYLVDFFTRMTNE